METKKVFKAILMILFSLVLVLTPALSRAATNADPPENSYRLSNVMIYSNSGDHRQIYTYDDCDNLINLLEQNLSEDEWVDAQLSTYTYDAYGNVLTKSVENYEYESVELYTYTRDCNGNVLTEIHAYPDWGFATKKTQEYDCDGNVLIQLTQYSEDMTEWYNDEMLTYTYDEKGNLVVITSFIWWWAEEWTESYYEKYTYDENGNQISTLLQYWALWEEPPVLENDSYYVSTYDENGNRLNYIGYSWWGNAWHENVMETYTYDGEGRCLTDITSYWMSGVWQDYGKVEYEYLVNQTLVEAWEWDWESMDWVPEGPVMLLLYNGGEVTRLWLGYAYYVEANLYPDPPLSAETCPAQTAYYGYPPMECATVGVSVTGGTPPYSCLWDNGETSESFVVCATETTDYSVIVTDANGCMAQACTKVEVIDVRCGNNMNKVELCHCPPGNPANCQTICVAQAAVPAHLAHGDLLGECGIDGSCSIYKTAPALAVTQTAENEIFLKVYPNPSVRSTTVSFAVEIPGKTRIWLTNYVGQTISTLFEGFLTEGDMQRIEVGLGNMQPGMYICTLQQSDGRMLNRKIIVQR